MFRKDHFVWGEWEGIGALVGEGREGQRAVPEGTAGAKQSGDELVQVQRMLVVRDEARESPGVEGRGAHR